MPELIDRQSALSVCKEYGWIDDEDFIEGYNTAIKYISEAIKELPTIKPKVRHGRWLNTEETVWDAKEIDGKQQIEISIVAAQCSVCGRWAEEVNNIEHRMLSKYCHWCGAIMDAKPPERGADNG